MRRHLFLGSIGGVAVFLRFFRLGPLGLSSDEAFCWRMTARPLGEMVERVARDTHPPGYFVALKAWIGWFGDSPTGLRSLSAVLGLASLLVFVLLLREYGRRVPSTRIEAEIGFGALLFAVSSIQVQQARNVRMYALGVLLAAVCAWLALRAARRPGIGRFASFGVAGAALIYTHYFGALTVVALATWCLVESVRALSESDRARASALVRGLAVASVVATALFLPWAPTFRAQAATVGDGALLSGGGLAKVLSSFAEWGGAPGVEPHWLAASVVACLTLWAACRAGAQASFFVIQIAVPWAFVLLTLLIGDRQPVFLARYFAFAHIALLALWALGFGAMFRRGERWTFAALSGGLVLFGLAHTLEIPAGLPAEAKAVRHLARRANPDDLVVVDDPWRLNRLRYYAHTQRAEWLVIRCVLRDGSLQRGVNPHFAALDPGDFISAETLALTGAPRVWWWGLSWEPWPNRPASWREEAMRTVKGGGIRYLLFRFERSSGPAGGPSPDNSPVSCCDARYRPAAGVLAPRFVDGP